MSDLLFRNPYHFVPLAPNVAPPAKVPLTEFDAEDPSRQHPHLTHDRYVRAAHSGRITCRVKVETPLICGNCQQDRGSLQTKLIHPFELDPGTPALPASALRGMLSALAEAASQSALKVLKGDVLSYRRLMGDEKKLSALGMIVQGETEGELRLRPMALPTMERSGNVYVLPKEFAGVFPAPVQKVYLGRGSYGEQLFLDAKGRPLQNVQMQKDGTLYPFYGMKLKEGDWGWGDSSTTLPARGEWQRHPTDKRDRHNPDTKYLIGRNPEEWQIVPWEPELKTKGYVRGIFRALGLWGVDRKDERPQTKKHEFFIPYTPRMEGWNTLSIPETVIQRFNQLADQRTDDNEHLPFEPIGTARGGEKDKLRLKPGDVVYFRPEKIGGETVVAEVSFSSIWRGRVETADGKGADTSTFFAAQSPDLLPLHPGRSELTLAEQLFGAVEVRDKKEEKTKDSFALAGRLRVSHGVLMEAPAAGHYQPHEELLSQAQKDALKQLRPADYEYPLKNLASPKPPSPALYFHPKSAPKGAYVPKKDLSPVYDTPLGRKFYLRRRHPGQVRELEVFVHPQRLLDEKDRPGIIKQHQSVKNLVRPGCEFEFHLDFNNLSDLELQLLVYVLTPAPAFRHQVGHGKPLGLGQMELQITGVGLVNRQHRYASDALTAPRCHQQWTSAEAPVELAAQLQEWRSAYRTWAQQQGLGQVLSALELLGTPPTDDHPIHYPQTDAVAPATREFEKELFKWFVENDRLKPERGEPSPQYLASLLGLTQLPVLKRQKGSEEKSAPRQFPRDHARSGATAQQHVSPPVGGQAALKALKGSLIQAKVVTVEPKPKLEVEYGGKTHMASLTGVGGTKALFAQLNPAPGTLLKAKVMDYNSGFVLELIPQA